MFLASLACSQGYSRQYLFTSHDSFALFLYVTLFHHILHVSLIETVLVLFFLWNEKG